MAEVQALRLREGRMAKARPIRKMGDTDYYIELDRGTERPVRIVEKCKTYVSYFLTEQRLGRLKSPYKVIWLVPDAKRKNSLDRHIKKHLGGNAWVFQIVLQPLFTDFLTAKIQNLLDFSGVPSDECKDPENLTVTKGAKNGETNEK